MKTCLFIGLLLLLPPFQEDFKSKAKAALDGEQWQDLEGLSRAYLETDPESKSGRAYLSFALAGQGKFDEAVAELVRIKEEGASITRSLGGIGNPLDRIINIIYLTCWANFNGDYNRKAWSALFNAFEEETAMMVPASRLLMAALLKKDEAEIRRMEAWFNGMLEQHEGNQSQVRNLSKNFARGYLRAEVGTPRVLELAEAAYRLGWEGAEDGYQSVEDPLERREKCDINTDSEYWDLAVACCLCGAFDPPENPLAEREPEPGAVFEEITEEAGLKGVGGTRVAAADFDQDGFTDLCFAGRLFRNEKGEKFLDVTKELGLGKTGSGALFFDYDNDGCLDLLVTAQPHPHLYRNLGRRGGFAFEDVTEQAGLQTLTVGASPEGAAVFDMDNDGWLDFYLAVYENPFPVGHPDLLVRNNGDGTFTDRSKEGGILETEVQCGRGVTCSDFDFDGDSDVFVSNYRLDINFLWRNDGEGRFTDIGEETGLRGLDQKGAFGHTIGSCWGDVDNDGDFDLFCANLAHPRYIIQGFSNLSQLHINAGPGEEFRFFEERRKRGIRFQETHSDPAFADYDNDGDLDLYITAIYKGAPSAFYQNNGKGFFEPVTFRSRSVVFNGWGQTWFDMENDGDLDHLIGTGSGVVLHRNLCNKNRWIKVKLKGKEGNLFGIGARVKVETPEGLVLLREVRAGRGTQSQDDPILHFGLGPDASAVKVEVTWPTGHVYVVRGKVNRIIEVKQRKAYPRKR